MPIVTPSYDLATLTQLCHQTGPREQDIKRLFCYYVYLTTGISIYHTELLNVSLSQLFETPAGMGRLFDLQELEHRFTYLFFNPKADLSRTINVKICHTWERHHACALPDASFTQVREVVSAFATEAYPLIGELTGQDYAALGARLTALRQLIERTHQQLTCILPREHVRLRAPVIGTVLDNLNDCCETSEQLFAKLIGLAKLRLTPEATLAINKTLSMLPQDKHALFFTGLLRIAERDLTELIEIKQAVIEYCTQVQQDSGWEDINLNQPRLPLSALLTQAKTKYLHNGRWPRQHNRRYLKFCEALDPSVPKLIHLIVLETGRFGKLHADSFFCLLLRIAQQQHSLSLFSECLPMADIDPEQLVTPSPTWWHNLWECRSSLPNAQQARDALLQLLRQADQNISLP